MKPISKTKTWILRFILMMGAPLTILILLEGGLRLAGFGYPSTLFLPQDNGTLGINSKYTWRFFDPKIARTPEPVSIPREKPTDTKRIFVLGGSAAKGVPHTAYSFSRILDVMLEEAYPGQKFEVYNVAMTAINSHVVLPIARECAKLEPDLFIIYMGNNEVVGPYGPGSVISGFQSNRSIIRASLWLKGTKTGQLLTNVLRGVGSDEDKPDQWTGMDIFVDKIVPAGDRRLRNVYAHLGSNVEDIIELGIEAGAEVIVSTVASNLKESPPFASGHAEGFSDSESKEWASLFEEAQALIEAKRYTEALTLIEECESLDDSHAQLAYEKGRALMGLGKTKDSRLSFIKARNLDELRFRADTALNQALRDAAKKYSEKGVVLVDAENAFGGSADSVSPVAGYDEFFEHVHFTFGGAYKLASIIFNQLSESIVGKVSQDRVSVPRMETCASRLALNDWSKIQQLDGIIPLIDRPPFIDQPGHDERFQSLRRESIRLITAVDADGGQEALNSYAQALNKRPEDPYLLQLIGELYFSLNRFDEALVPIEKAQELLPLSYEVYTQLAYVYSRSNRVEESLPYFRKAIELSPYYFQAQIDYASALAHLGRLNEAEAVCLWLTKIQPGDSAYRFGYGYVLLQAKKYSAAETELTQAFTISPDAFHLRQLSDKLLIEADMQATVRIFDELYLKSNDHSDAAFATLVNYYVGQKDFTSAKFYQLRREEMEAKGK